MKSVGILICILCFVSAASSQKKAMTPDVYSQWNRISNVQISHHGYWVFYNTEAEQHDANGYAYERLSNKTVPFERCKKATLTTDGKYVVYLRVPSVETAKSEKRKKVKKKDLSKDSLVVFNLKTNSSTVIPDVREFYIGEEWQSHVGFRPHIDEKSEDSRKATDSTYVKQSDDNGSDMIIMNLQTKLCDTIKYCKQVKWSKFHPRIIAAARADADNVEILELDLISGNKVRIAIGDDLSLMDLGDDKGHQSRAILIKNDSTESTVPNIEIWHAANAQYQKLDLAKIMGYDGSQKVSSHFTPKWDQGADKLFFAWALPLPQQDTMLIEEEIVNVEVWHTSDPKLYTQMEYDLEGDKKINIPVVFNVLDQVGYKLSNAYEDRVLADVEWSSPHFFVINEQPYQKYVTWQGYEYFDLYLTNINSGKIRKVASKLCGRPELSPDGDVLIWFDIEQSTYMMCDLAGNLNPILSNKQIAITDELNDVPQHPDAYGIVGWPDDKKTLLVYDRYDIWQVPLYAQSAPINLTKMRDKNIKARRIKWDNDERYIDLKLPMPLHLHHESSRQEGYAYLFENSPIDFHLNSKKLKANPLKAKNEEWVVTTEEDFSTFPNLILTDTRLKPGKTFTNVNPQQSDYLWGSIEHYIWTNAKGEKLTGLLVKPENFDPKKKYPLVVNFYERSSQDLYDHRQPFAHRSAINYTYYASKGYIIFNPDITYEIGYPGRSCEEDLISGVEALVKEGYIDHKRMGIQGHSWGGYQVAHLVTKTNMFACAESGAPVVNMVSAYGGIRWGSGLSRMFQYERTQSRIGRSLWEDSSLYLENSPIFNLDKVKTPILIMHNDEDGAVPWYQGIEFFVGLRRLGNPAWLLNYNGEPHWPVAWKNRLDFNIRMEQFLDHYLLNKPMPKWMKEGVSPMEKGINQKLD